MNDDEVPNRLRIDNGDFIVFGRASTFEFSVDHIGGNIGSDHEKNIEYRGGLIEGQPKDLGLGYSRGVNPKFLAQFIEHLCPGVEPVEVARRRRLPSTGIGCQGVGSTAQDKAVRTEEEPRDTQRPQWPLSLEQIRVGAESGQMFKIRPLDGDAFSVMIRHRQDRPIEDILRGAGGPRRPNSVHLRFHPRLPFAYSSNEHGGGISAWRLDPKAGTLKLVQTLSTLPEGFQGKSSGAEVRITPDGRFAYVSNRDHRKQDPQDTLAVFAIDGEGGLRKAGHARCPHFPRAFSLDAKGERVLVAGQRDHRLAVYRIAEDGALRELSRREVGEADGAEQLDVVGEGRAELQLQTLLLLQRSMMVMLTRTMTSLLRTCLFHRQPRQSSSCGAETAPAMAAVRCARAKRS